MTIAILNMLVWAVHIDDGVLSWPVWASGFAGAALLILMGAWRIREGEIPRIALLTAAFFVSSLIHVPLGVTSVHLLLNGLLGVILGRRAAIAIPVGLFLQVALFKHGGFSTLGINSCIMTLPALLAWQMFVLLQRLPGVRQPWFHAASVAFCALGWTLSLVYGLALLFEDNLSDWSVWFHLGTWLGALLIAGLAIWLERRLRNHPEFPVGLLVGETTVLATILLQTLVLTWGGQKAPDQQRLAWLGERLGLVQATASSPQLDNAEPSAERHPWRLLALVMFLAHLPLAVIEGTVLGFTVGFLVRVKPEMLGWTPPEKTECQVDTLP